MHNFISVLGSETDCDFNWTLNLFMFTWGKSMCIQKSCISCISMDVLLTVRLNDFDVVSSLDHPLNTF